MSASTPPGDTGRASGFHAVSPAAHVLDRRLHELRTGRQAAAEALAELEDEDTYAVLAAEGRLSGTTASAARPALARVAETRGALARVDALLDRVAGLRDAGHVDHLRATDLVALLNRPAIVVPEGPDGGPAEVRTAQEVFAAVDAVVEDVRGLLRAVDTAWGEFVPRLDRATAEGERLAADLPANPVLADARSLLTVLPDLVVEDPLGAVEELSRVTATLADLSRVRDEVVRLRAAVAAGRQAVAELEALVAEGHHALARSRVEVRDPQGLLDPVDPEILTGERGLRPWLDRLERLAGEGQVALAGRGIERWQALADQTRAAARTVADANARPSLRRRELLGLLRAARVKAGAAGRAEDPALTALAERADSALDVPCDLGAAEAAVGAYLDEVRRAPARPGGSGRRAWRDREPKEMSA